MKPKSHVTSLSMRLGLGMRSDISGSRHSQQQSGDFDTQCGDHSQDKRIQAWGAEEITVYQTEFHVLEAEP